MRLNSIIVIIFMFFSTRGICQTTDTASAQTRADNLTNTMTCELGLYQNQVDKIYAINLVSYKKIDEANKSARGNTKQFNSAVDDIARDRDAQLKDALTKKQWAMYEKITNGSSTALKLTRVCRKPDQDTGF